VLLPAVPDPDAGGRGVAVPEVRAPVAVQRILMGEGLMGWLDGVSVTTLVFYNCGGCNTGQMRESGQPPPEGCAKLVRGDRGLEQCSGVYTESSRRTQIIDLTGAVGDLVDALASDADAAAVPNDDLLDAASAFVSLLRPGPVPEAQGGDS
jgi:hypothetical protein